MTYTDEVLFRLRQALLQYRHGEKLKGRKLSWDRIALNLFDTVLEPEPGSEEQDVRKALAEALRRFAGGLQVPSAHRLEALSRYLVSRGYLRPEDLEPVATPPSVTPVLRAFFGAGATNQTAQALCGTFFAARPLRDGKAVLSLLAVAPHGEEALYVSDREVTLPGGSLPKETDGLQRHLRRAAMAETRLEGWLVEGPNRQVFAFVRDELWGEATIYCVLQEDRDPSGARPSGKLTILKTRDFGATPPYLHATGMSLSDGSSDEDALRRVWFAGRLWNYERQRERT